MRACQIHKISVSQDKAASRKLLEDGDAVFVLGEEIAEEERGFGLFLELGNLGWCSLAARADSTGAASEIRACTDVNKAEASDAGG